MATNTTAYSACHLPIFDPDPNSITPQRRHPMKSNLKEKYAGWGRGGEKYEPVEFKGRSNRRDEFITDNSLLESLASHHRNSQCTLRQPTPGPSVMRPSADLRVRFVSPRQQRIEEEIAYHSFELKNLAMELDATSMHREDMHREGPGHNRRAGRHHGLHSDQYSAGEDSSTLLSHDSFSVEASIDYVKPKSSSKWKRSGSPFRVHRSKSPSRDCSKASARSKSPHRVRERERGRSPGREGGGGRRHYDV